MSLESFDPEHLFVRGVVTGNLAGYLSGRTTIIERIANRLAASDQSCVIYGERGVGKSTVARQVSSLLAGDNLVFDKSRTLEYGADKVFRPCMARVSADWETAGDLLLECVTTDDGPDTFVGRYREALTNEAFVTEFTVKFGFNLAKVFTGEVGAKIGHRDLLQNAQTDKALQSNERLKRRIFQSFLTRARSVDPNHDPKIIFFVDEMDRKPRLPGLGEALKDLNDVQFCFIGIAETIDDIIADHESAGRKLTGGGFPIDGLSDQEVSWIFDNAVHMASGLVTFDGEFRDRVLQYSEGMPWIAQHVGYEAVFAELAPARRRGNSQLLIKIDAFGPAMRAAIELYRNRFNEQYNIERILEDRGPTGLEVLKVLLRSRDSMTEMDIKNALPPEHLRLKRWIPTAIEKFVTHGILIKRGENYSFSNALLRVFTRYHIDEVENSSS